MKSRRAAFALSLVFALLMGAAFAQADAGEEPMDPPTPGQALRDRDFGVVTHQFGLDRQVEMYQWRAQAGGYTQVWSAGPIDSSRFAPGHQNPAKLPLEGRRWLAQDARLDGKPIDPSVLQTLGQWRVFRPNFSRLPANLAASFQPEGDGLGSAENPLEPGIGDLRIFWRELHLPPLDGKVELRGGRWQLTPVAAAQALSGERASTVVELPDNEDRKLLPWLLAGAVVLAAIGLVWRRLRRRSAAR
ncbi:MULTISPECIES: TMEM43 family protein [unclassified Lysobacter]|uniref:TMEM43 family protein n=1 Tax=unclassified Lysobacter TaxID=2635362 RepID=UPI001C23DC26|nr:TMEM43 family protein [Lysobacter sp. MMG2]MBU8976370.1 TMEM43 family protein [Lysobacter sp. MMG2]